MRNFYFLCLLAFFTSWQLSAQVTIGTGVETNKDIPVDLYYGYTYSQIIYLQSDIGAAMDIGKLTYYPNENVTLANSSDWTIYIGHTTKTQFDSNTDWIDVTTLTEVFTGTVSVGDAEVNIYLDTPFSYNGTDNLVIAVDENQPNYDDSNHHFFCTASPGNQSILYRNDTTNPDPAAPPQASFGQPQSFIANVTLSPPSACPPVSNISVTNITSNSVDLSWTVGGSEMDWEYVIQVAGTGAPTGNGTPVNGTPMVSDMSLSPAQPYEVFVRAACTPGSEYSDWIGPIDFSTLCAPLAVVYEQNFDAEIPPALNQCWSDLIENASSTFASVATYLGTTSQPAFSPPNVARFYNSSDTSGTYYLVSPQFSDMGTDKRARFQMRMNTNGSDEGDSIKVGTMSDPTMSSTFTELATFTQADFTEDEWVEKIVNLTSYNGTDEFIAIQWTPGTGTFNSWYVDNFVYEPMPACAYPISLMADIVNGTTATFTWTAGNMETEWEYFIQETGLPEPTSGTSISTNSYTDTTLTPGTTYDFYVRANCGADGYSEWSLITLDFNYCSAIPATNDGNGITNINFQGTDYPVEDVTYYDNSDTVTDITAGQSANLLITFATGYSYWSRVWIDFNDDLVFEESEQVASLNSLSDNPTTADLSFEVPADAPEGIHGMRIGTADSGQDADPGNPCYSGSYGVNVDWTVNVVAAPQISVDNGFVSSIVVAGTTDPVTSIQTCQTADVLVQAFEPGVTDVSPTEVGAELAAWVAYYTEDTDPSTWPQSVWVPATYSQDVAGNDEFSASLMELAAGTYYIATRIQLQGGVFVFGGDGGIYDGSTYGNVQLEVTEPLAITASASLETVCAGDEVTLMVASDDSSYTYEWNNEAGMGASVVVNPMVNTMYIVTGTNAAGCMVSDTVQIMVNPIPTSVTVTPMSVTSCEGGNPIELMAMGGGINFSETVLFTEGFDSCVMPDGWATSTSTGTNIDPEDCGAGLFSFACTDGTSFSGPANDNFDGCIAAISDDDAGSGFVGTATITSAVMGEAAQAERDYVIEYDYSWDELSSVVNVEVFDGTDWQLVFSYGAPDSAGHDSILVTPYMNPNFQIRWTHDDNPNGTPAWAWGFGFDNVEVIRLDPIDGNFTWSPMDNLYSDAEATTPYTGEVTSTVYALPVGTMIYTATAVTDAGCISEGTAEIVITSGSTPPTAEANQEFCEEYSPTIGDLVAEGNEVIWYDEATGGNQLDATTLLQNGVSYFAADISPEGCESITRTEVTVVFNPALCPANNNDCADAEALAVNQPASFGDTTSTSGESFDACGAMTDGVWYTVVGDGADLTATVSPFNWDAEMAILSGTCDGGFTCVDGADNEGVAGVESVTWDSVEGETYYILVGTNESLSEGEFSIQITTNMNVDDINNVDSSITLYPNPVIDILTINASHTVKEVQVYNTNGSLVLDSVEIVSNKINVQHLQTGTYVIKMILDDNSVITDKFIKQ